ncbi:uncharacterized protein LOC111712841 [Eurytemora carolleeae]|uniref:uncharacterized protein LOC111712841 n=1 Tax=Eurytemora carolleeae TaxID=1294199 RepID=UPI000C75E8C9|nr:uncharacterized protein LOC111712841 [Eurytemora carolleeae]|eukprot:XP_023343350.1 uncharacterized protein LOC111712841 [Eurytemora affinis]
MAVSPGSPVCQVSWLNHEHDLLLAVSGYGGKLTVVNLTSGVEVGILRIEENTKIESLQVYKDDPLDCIYLIIKTKVKFYRLLVDQKSIGYSWTGSTSCDPPSTPTQENPLPDIIESRGRLSGLKQMSVEKITNLRNRLAEGRKLLRSKSECEDIFGSSSRPICITPQIGPCSHLVFDQGGGGGEGEGGGGRGCKITAFYSTLSQSVIFDAQLNPGPNSTKSFPFLMPSSPVCSSTNSGYVEIFVPEPSSVSSSYNVTHFNVSGNLCLFCTDDGRNQTIILSSFSSEDTLLNSPVQSITLDEGEKILDVHKINTSRRQTSTTSPCSSQPGFSPTSKSSSQASPTSKSSVQAYPTSKSSPHTSTAKKNPFRNIVCVTTDETGRTRTDVLQAPASSVSSMSGIKTDTPKNNENTKPICSAEAFKLHLEKELNELKKKNSDKLESFLIVTSKQVYILDWKAHPVDLCLELIIQGSMKEAEIIIACFHLNKNVMQELAADLKLSCKDYSAAISLYKQCGARCLKIALKLAVFGCVSQLLAYLQVLFSNKNHDSTHREKVHLANLTLISYFQQILKSTMFIKQRLEDKFANFLLENRCYDEVLMVSQGVDTGSWSLLSRVVFKHGLERELAQGLAGWFENMNKVGDISGLILLDHVGSEKEHFLNILLNPTLIPASGISCSIALSLFRMIGSILPVLSWVQLVSLVSNTDPRNPDLSPLMNPGCGMNGGEENVVIIKQELVRIHVLSLLHILNRKSLVDPSLFNLISTSDTPMSRSIRDPAAVPVVLESRLSAGFSHVLYNQNGNLVSWGSNNLGATGLKPSYAVFFTPGSLSFFTKLCIKVLQVSCGKNHSMVLSKNGVYVWGSNHYGQLGSGKKIIQSNKPIRLSLESIVQISAGQFHSLALDSSGLVYSWGWGVHGQLGNGHFDDVEEPQVVHRLSKLVVVQVAAGYAHSLCLTENGEIWSFGLGLYGQLGSGHTDKSLVPVRVVLNAPVRQVSTGYFHCLAISVDGTVYQWGSHPQVLRLEAQQRKKEMLMQKDQDQDLEASESPVSLPTFIPPVSEQHLTPQVFDTSGVRGRVNSISCGSQHSLILTDQGQVYTWGRNMEGQLGQGGRNSTKLPALIVGLDQDYICAAVCGSDFTLALSESGSLFGWGSNSSCQLGRPPLEPDKGTEQSKVLLMKTTKRIIRLQHGLQNSCDIPKPVPGIQKSGIYAEQINKTPQEYLVSDLYPTQPGVRTELSPGLEENHPSSIHSLQFNLHRILEEFSSSLNIPSTLQHCVQAENFQAAAKLCFLDGKHLESFKYTLKSILLNEKNEKEKEDLSFQMFLIVLSASSKQPSEEYRSLQFSMLQGLIKFWTDEKLELTRLEDKLVQIEDTVLLNTLVYILFCPPTSDLEENRLTGVFSPEFLLRIGNKFVNTSNEIRSEPSSFELNNPEDALRYVLRNQQQQQHEM